MTKNRALVLLAARATSIFLPAAVIAHWLWYYRRRRLISIMLLSAGAAAALATAITALVPRFRPGNKTVFSGKTGSGKIALTFDDGPREPYTRQILDILKQEGVRVTFFVLGENAARYPDIIKRMMQEGHQVANHGYDHSILMFADGSEAERQIAATELELARAGITRPDQLFRAPHGWLSSRSRRRIQALDYRVIGWTRGVWDTASPGVEAIISRTEELLTPGAILLLHDGWHGERSEDRSQAVAALPGIIAAARRRDLEFVTVSGLTGEGRRHE
jgi:peptidoglycan/xylan/chitin deacetylase (PgdA/CDA1 family)